MQIFWLIGRSRTGTDFRELMVVKLFFIGNIFLVDTGWLWFLLHRIEFPGFPC